MIIGDGPLKEVIEGLNRELNAGVIFIPNTPKKVVLGMVSDAYAYIVVLSRLNLFLRAIVPILLDVEGEAKELFIETGAAVIAVEPENDSDLSEAVLKLAGDSHERDAMGVRGLEYVNEHFNRRMIARRFLEELED
ncbi:hypothetical protein N8648_04225 [Verrucomicrobia bacterium]|nr:hypothetical protein [Verrucomicrobiota bacterium]